MTRGDLSYFADLVILTVAAVWFVGQLLDAVAEVVLAVNRWRSRRKRMRDGDRWADARRAARQAAEAQMRAEGRWDNFELQDRMDAAGYEAVPTYSPFGRGSSEIRRYAEAAERVKRGGPYGNGW